VCLHRLAINIDSGTRNTRLSEHTPENKMSQTNRDVDVDKRRVTLLTIHTCINPSAGGEDNNHYGKYIPHMARGFIRA
jgi:hypothetical protein